MTKGKIKISVCSFQSFQMASEDLEYNAWIPIHFYFMEKSSMNIMH